jgi:O-acetyl-ADP-ribose deacetylase (regulator of RNase III)
MIRYLKGDATAPQVDGPAVIVHVCNDEGKWGKGFVLAVSRRWTEPERTYRSAFEKPPFPALGDVQFVKVAEDLTVANLIGQHGVRSARSKAPPPIRYPAVKTGLEKVAEFVVRQNATVAMPRIGSGLAGGSWEEIEKIVEQTLGDVEVQVYDL